MKQIISLKWQLAILVILLPSILCAQVRTITRISVASDGTEANGASDGAAINQDGSFVAYRSVATNLIPGDTRGQQDVFLHNASDSSTKLISIGLGNTPANDDSGVSKFSSRPIFINTSGNYISFASKANNLSSFDSNSSADAFVYSSDSGTIEIASVQYSFGSLLGDSDSGPVSGDGSVFVYTTEDVQNSGFTDQNNEPDVYRRLPLGFFSYLQSFSFADSNAAGNSGAKDATMSDDGTGICFASEASNLLTSDANKESDIFCTKVEDETTTLSRLSESAGGTEANGASSQPYLNNSATLAVFASTATNLITGTGGGTSGTQNIYIKNRGTNAVTLVSVGLNNAAANGASSLPSVSSDGRYVAFLSDASNLVKSDTNGVRDAFVRDLETDKTIRINLSANDSQSTLPALDCEISADGSYVVLSSADPNLVANDTNGASDVFLVQFSPVITPDTPIDEAPELTTKTRTNSRGERVGQISVTLPEYSFGTPDNLGSASLDQKAAKIVLGHDFVYNVAVRGTAGKGVKGTLIKKQTKRNTLAFKNLKPGSYSVSYKVSIREVSRNKGKITRKVVSRSSKSPSGTATIS